MSKSFLQLQAGAALAARALAGKQLAFILLRQSGDMDALKMRDIVRRLAGKR